MKIDNLRRYVDLRNSLAREKAQLEERLSQINQALGETEAPAPKTASPRQPASAPRRGRPAKSGLSLREAVLEVTANGPMTKQEILDGVKALGYRFSTSNPMNSLGVILYGKNPKFKNEGGRFSPVGAGASSSRGATASGSTSGAKGNGSAFKRKKRKLSPEARERIAAAQRERWAKVRGGK